MMKDMIKDHFGLKIAPEHERAAVCCFTGNRPHKLPWREREDDARCVAVKQRLSAVIDELIASGVKLFVCGMARGGDTYFAEAVLEKKSEHGDVALECALPCPQQADEWSACDRARYDRILQCADYVTTVSDAYSDTCMRARNHYMVDKSATIITLNYSYKGGTAATVRYAAEKGLKIIELNDK